MNPLNFLFVEDDELTNQLTGSMLDSLGLDHDYQFSTNGYEALKYLKKCTQQGNAFPQVIFVDLKMPVVDGFEFIDLFEQDYLEKFPCTKIFVLTSSTRSSDVENAIAFKSVVDYLPKPLTEDVFKSILHKMNIPIKAV